ncbi:hypothetical protein [Cellulophaga baltica]|uniref:hypothetical protein n=1 Tax=Cellulophaga baltica TaxID=76594 RepID=UPI0003F53F54|nr:hypothetical protein [Cellulophaga baltica]AIY14408.1 hypothetical protein M667_15110 [Cellulophaga baltica NN016038]
MRKSISALLLILSISSCAQQNKKETGKETTPTPMDIKAILEDDPYIGQLKKYDYEPEYVLKITTLYAYEIRVNDIPVAHNFSTMGGTIWFPINKAILQSGKQTLSITIYPRYTDENTQKDYFEDPDDYDFWLDITQTAWIDGSREEPKTVLEYEMPRKDDRGKEIDFSKLTSRHDELTFTAKVPYTLTGWSESKVIDKKDSVAIEQRVVAFYQKYRQLMVDKKPLELQILELKQAYETSQYSYLDKDKLFKDRKEYVRDFPEELFIMAKLENYELKFYGNNRVLGLIFTQDPDKGYSAMAKKFLDKNDNRMISFYSLLLHQPKGSDSLEVIR